MEDARNVDFHFQFLYWMKTREDEEVREVIPHIGSLPIVIPLKLFLDFLRDPVFPRGLSDSQSYVPIFAMSTAERFSTQ